MHDTAHLDDGALSNMCAGQKHDIHANPHAIIDQHRLAHESKPIRQGLTFVIVILRLNDKAGPNRHVVADLHIPVAIHHNAAKARPVADNGVLGQNAPPRRKRMRPERFGASAWTIREGPTQKPPAKLPAQTRQRYQSRKK